MAKNYINNIFQFATKELSQDAFIAWLIYSINCNDNDIELRRLAGEFLINIIQKKENLKKWEQLIKNYCEEPNTVKCEIDVDVQFYHIDILVTIHDIENDQYLMIIIEDKVDTLEHDNQIKKYKCELTDYLEKDDNKKKITKKLENKNILTCYYKIYDEADIENKEVDKVYTRKDIYTLFGKYKDNIKHQFFQDYFKYIKAVEECASNYEKDECNAMIYKRKKDIKYLSFFKRLEEKYKDYIDNFAEEYEDSKKYGNTISKGRVNDNIIIPKETNSKEKIYYGIASTSAGKTWWCNIPINLKIVSDDLFDRHAFIKINFYEKSNTTITLKFAKKRKWVKDENDYQNYVTKGEYGIDQIKYYYDKDKKYYNVYKYYDKRVFNNDNIFNELIKMLKGSQISQKYKIKKSGIGTTKTQPEINIFTINIEEKSEQFEQVNEVVKNLIADLNEKDIKIADKKDNKILYIKE